MSSEKQRQTRKRPVKQALEQKRPTLNFRLSPEDKDAVQAAATAAGRSISEEIELRIIRSFDAERTMTLLIREASRIPMKKLSDDIGAGNLGFLLALGYKMSDVEMKSGRPWQLDENSRNAVESEMHGMIGYLLRNPPPPYELPEDVGRYSIEADFQARVEAETRRRLDARRRALVEALDPSLFEKDAEK